MSTTTTRLALYKPASGENVNVATDLNNNLDAIDTNMNFRSCTSGTRPSVKWDGLTIHETDTNRSYVWNAAPATSGWFEVFTAGGALSQINLNGASTGAYTVTSNSGADTHKRFQIRADGRLEFGTGLADTDTYMWRPSANMLRTNGSVTTEGNVVINGTTDSTSFTTAGGGTFTKSLSVGGTASLGGGQGVFNLKNATTAPTASPSGGLILYSNTSGQLLNLSPSGLTTRLNGATQLSATSNNNTFTSERVIGTLTIPANDAVVGATYRIRAWGVASTTSTPTYTLRTRINGLAGTQLASNSGIASTGTVSNRPWTVEAYLVILSSGGSGSCMGQMIYEGHISTAGVTATPERRFDGTTTVSSIDWTTAKDFVLTVQCSASSASNIFNMNGIIAERIS